MNSNGGTYVAHIAIVMTTSTTAAASASATTGRHHREAILRVDSDSSISVLVSFQDILLNLHAVLVVSLLYLELCFDLSLSRAYLIVKNPPTPTEKRNAGGNRIQI